jgi:hypothetical protein
MRAGVAVPVPGAAEVAAAFDQAHVGDARLASRAPVTRPANPPPMKATVTSSVTGSRSTRSVKVSSRKWAKRPVGSMYWSEPSLRRRLSRSAR